MKRIRRRPCSTFEVHHSPKRSMPQQSLEPCFDDFLPDYGYKRGDGISTPPEFHSTPGAGTEGTPYHTQAVLYRGGDFIDARCLRMDGLALVAPGEPVSGYLWRRGIGSDTGEPAHGIYQTLRPALKADRSQPVRSYPTIPRGSTCNVPPLITVMTFPDCLSPSMI